MSTREKNLYKQVTVTGSKKDVTPPGSRAYRGISTVNPDATSWVLYDIALIKQDILNNFHIRQGEKLSDPEFGTIIWDVLFEPLTENLKDAIVSNVTKIVNNDPRVQVNNIIVDTYESGIQVECSLVFLPYNISESMRLQFDENAGFLQ
jgi:phage baseplate assembly protein W